MGVPVRSTNILAGAGTLALGLTLAGIPASADRPMEGVMDDVFLWCTSSTEEAYVEFSAYYSPEGTWRDGWAQAIVPVGEEEYAEYWAYMGEGSYGDDAFDATYALADPEGTGVGTLAFEGSATPLGDPEEISDRSRDGNRWNEIEGWVQQLWVEVTVATADGGVLPAPVPASFTCMGAEQDLTFWSTNPATTVYHSRDVGGAWCEFEDALLMINISPYWTDALVALGIDWEVGEAEAVYSGPLTQDGDSLAGDLPQVYPEDVPEPGTAIVDLTIGDLIDRTVTRTKLRDYSAIVRSALYELTGSVTAAGFEALEVDCQIEMVDGSERYFSKAGSKPGGKPPVNDLPEAAKLLLDGRTAHVSTRGAAEEPEAPCTVSYQVGEDEWIEEEIPFGRTVWYTFPGTGGWVDLSTEGSDYDTVLGVYTIGEGGAFDQVACVDDTLAGLRAEVSLETESGVEYLVQAGGFGGSWGKLVLARE